jgi:hypothetical protein
MSPDLIHLLGDIIRFLAPANHEHAVAQDGSPVFREEELTESQTPDTEKDEGVDERPKRKKPRDGWFHLQHHCAQ